MDAGGTLAADQPSIVVNTSGSAELLYSTDTVDMWSGAYMVEGPYGWHEYCPACADPIINTQHRRAYRISRYQVLTAGREYKCCQCGSAFHDENRKDD